MEKGRRWARMGVGVAVVLLVAIGGVFVYRYLQMRSEGVPDFEEIDLNDRIAGTIDRFKGEAFMRPSLPEDLAKQAISPAPSPGAAEWTPVTQGAPVYLGTLFHIRPGGSVQVVTAGQWILLADGEGEFIFEDARRKTGLMRTAFWHVKKGNFRAKPHDYDPADHWLQIKTANARVIIHQGEIGLRINEAGSGQIWLVSGKEGATILYNDGRRKRLEKRGMDYI